MNKYVRKYQIKWNRSATGHATKKKYRQSIKGKAAAATARKKHKEKIKKEHTSLTI